MPTETTPPVPVSDAAQAERSAVEAMRDWHAGRDAFVWNGPVRRAIYERRSDDAIRKLTEIDYPGGVEGFLADSPAERKRLETAECLRRIPAEATR